MTAESVNHTKHTTRLEARGTKRPTRAAAQTDGQRQTTGANEQCTDTETRGRRPGVLATVHTPQRPGKNQSVRPTPGRPHDDEWIDSAYHKYGKNIFPYLGIKNMKIDYKKCHANSILIVCMRFVPKNTVLKTTLQIAVLIICLQSVIPYCLRTISIVC